ncbi:ferritin-like domain-containing protein [Candidatus Gracilibacteria bacterium]|nr:ferritin-like domain-containing protein [Candidatus Gracilibacteria bacterium]NJM89712.1 ferritin-like domain-containing protein [Hydrococcus sp. RU_2_2]NJP21404.1 ferritin-like domain-containing protein [Hydrococcus sp. CRU_1_1]
MNLLTSFLHLMGSGAAAYFSACNLRDPLTRPNFLATFQLAESGSVPFLEALKERAQAEGDVWLTEQLTRHASDEMRHGQIFAHALKQLGKQVIDFKQLRQENESKSQEKRSPFFDAYFEGYSREDLKPDRIDWLVFLGSTYILELDASKDFVRMAQVLPDNEPKARSLKQGMLSVAQDETRHAAYLYEALQRRLSQAQVDAIVARWRTRKVHALVAMIGNLLQKGGKTPSLVTDGVPVENEVELSVAA